MLQNLAGLLRRTARVLEELVRPTSPDTVLEEPEEQPTSPEEPPSPDDQAVLAVPPPVKPAPPRLWQRFVSAEQARLRWLWNHPYVIGIALGLAVAVVIAEKWLIQAWDWLTSQAPLFWPYLSAHPVALIGVGVILFYLLFGLQWLRLIDDLVHWVLGGIKSRPRLSALVAGILAIIGLWLISNRGTWVILPFAVGQMETMSLEGEEVTIQLISELNQVGVGNPPPVLNLWELREPHT